MQTPFPEDDKNIDFSELHQRIAEIKEKSKDPQRMLVQMFVENNILPTLKDPNIFLLIKNPEFEEALVDLIVNFIIVTKKTL